VADHEICHVEFPSRNLAESQEFYEELFGWKMEPMGDDYVLFMPWGGPGGGFNPLGERWKPRGCTGLRDDTRHANYEHRQSILCGGRFRITYG